jgi:HAD superfamily hydrolase (TIGR01509 family)
MTHIKAVIFDIGYVVHSYDEEALEHAIAEWADVSVYELRTVLPDLFHEWGLGHIASEEEFCRKILETLDRRPRSMPDHSLVLEGCEEWKVDKGVMRLIARLKSRSYIVAALSNTIKPHADWLRSRGVYVPFNPVILSFQEGCRKPDPEIYMRTLDRCGVAAESAVFIDDKLVNVEGAQHVGMNGIHFRSVTQLEVALKELNVSM